MEPLVPGYFFHIYNHANGSDLLFREEKNYNFFLLKLKEHVVPIADVYAFCLMPNHYHFLVKIKDETILQQLADFPSKEFFPKFQTLEKVEKAENLMYYFISKQFSNFYSSYTQAFNLMYNRRGSLFIKNFKRKKITDESYFIGLVNYIHFNPVEHGFVNRPAEWKYSSYNAIISKKTTLVKRDEVLEWFGGLANFMYNHLRPMDV